MAQYTITIPDTIVTQLINNIAIRFGYEDQIFNPAFNPELPSDPDTNPQTIPNPENKTQFAKRMNMMWLKKVYQQGMIKQRLLEIKNDLNELS